uniref:Ribosomal protein eL8/eL30/eS12/Gadd45 domain-containing protein n=1 Tax=Strigamia maritima TaxID=126957 RepID=T1J4K5_STRMM
MFYPQSRVEDSLLNQRPLVLDPSNPYNNIAYDLYRKHDVREKFERFADVSLVSGQDLAANYVRSELDVEQAEAIQGVMEKIDHHDSKNQTSTLSVDVEPFVPRQQQSQTSCATNCTSMRTTQRPQGIPPYITSCYPFVQEDCAGCDYKNTPWSTYVPPQFSFQFSGLQASSTAQRCTYSRYPPSQLSPRYNTGFYSQYKNDPHYTWDGVDRNKNWVVKKSGNWKYQDAANYLDLQQQEYYFQQHEDGRHISHPQEFYNSARTFINRPAIRKANKSKDSQREGSTSETSSTDLSSQSSHTRTLGDFFPSLKSVKRSKSLPNSAAKFESPRGKSCKSVPSALKPADINEWPSPNASSSGEKSVKNPYVFESALNKPKSFAEIIKTKPTEQKTNTVHFDTNTMSAEELKACNKPTKGEMNININLNKVRPNQLKSRLGKNTQFFQQPKYYTDISPRCVVNPSVPTTVNDNSEMHCSASCSDIRALRTPRNDPIEIQRRVIGRPMADHILMSRPGDKTPRENAFASYNEDSRRMSKFMVNKMISAENMSVVRQPLADRGLTFIFESPPDNVLNCGGEIRHCERQLQEHKNSMWRYSARYRNMNWNKSHHEWLIENPAKYSKEKSIYPRHRSHMVKTNVLGARQGLVDFGSKGESVDSDAQTDDMANKVKKKKKKTTKEKNQSRKNQLAAVQGKMLLLSPEMYSKLMDTSNHKGELKDLGSNSQLDNEEEYPELGGHSSKDTTPRVKRVASTTEDDEWSDVDSDYDLVDGILNSPGRLSKTPREGKAGGDKPPLSYSAALQPSSSSLKENVSEEQNGGKKKTKGLKKKVSAAQDLGQMIKNKPIKPKKNAPIQLDITEMLNQCEKKKKLKKTKVGFSVNKWSRPQNFPVVANILDSTAPSRRRGKERELPAKKHPSALKKIILREREQRKKIRKLEEQTKVQQNTGSDVEGADSAWETQGSNSSTTASICGGIEDETKKLLINAASIVHSRRFREYCDHMLNPEIDSVVTRLLQDLIRFHTRLYHKDPIKAKSRRRVVLGLREVTKHLKLKRLKCIILAPNLDRIRSKGGLDDAIESIINLAKEQEIPYVFALGRKLLGRVCYKQVPVSCVGIFNYAGSEANFNQLMELVARAQVEYSDLVSRAQVEYQRMLETVPKSEGQKSEISSSNEKS